MNEKYYIMYTRKKKKKFLEEFRVLNFLTLTMCICS